MEGIRISESFKRNDYQLGNSKLTIKQLKEKLKRRPMTLEEIAEKKGCSTSHAKYVAHVKLDAHWEQYNGSIYFALDKSSLQKYCNENFGDSEQHIPPQKADISNFYNSQECEKKSSQNPSKQKSGNETSDNNNIHIRDENSHFDRVSQNAVDHIPLEWYQLIEEVKNGKDKLTLPITQYLLCYNGVTHKFIAHKTGYNRSSVTKKVGYLRRIGVLESDYEPHKDRKSSANSKTKLSKCRVNPKFIGMAGDEFSHFHPRGCGASENGWFRPHNVQRVFKLVNFDKNNVDMHVLKKRLREHYGFYLKKEVKRSSYRAHIFVNDKYPQFKIEFCNHRFIVREADKFALWIPVEEFPNSSDEYFSDLIEHTNAFAKLFADALSEYNREPVKISDTGWLGENPSRGKPGKAKLPHVAYVDPDGIIERAIEDMGSHIDIKGLGWFTDGSITPYKELEFANDDRSSSVEKACEFNKTCSNLSNPEVVGGLIKLYRGEPNPDFGSGATGGNATGGSAPSELVQYYEGVIEDFYNIAQEQQQRIEQQQQQIEKKEEQLKEEREYREEFRYYLQQSFKFLNENADDILDAKLQKSKPGESVRPPPQQSEDEQQQQDDDSKEKKKKKKRKDLDANEDGSGMMFS